MDSTEVLLHVRPVEAHADAPGREAFDLYAIPGRKRLVQTNSKLILSADHGAHRLRVSLSSRLCHGSPFGIAAPLDAHLRTRLPAYQAQARMLDGGLPASVFRSANRLDRLHLHGLLALDAVRVGARHREIAEVLFGKGEVIDRWTADGEMRAYIRHLIARADGLMHGGYRSLAGVSRACPAALRGGATH